MPNSTAKTSVVKSGHGLNLLALLLVAGVVRGLVLVSLPAGAISADLNAAKIISQGLMRGMNPYAHGAIYNYSPFWMEFVYCVMKFANRFTLDFVLCYRMALIAADLGVLAALFGLLRLLNPQARYMRLLLIGYCLNPVLILVSVQHANIDAIAMVWVVLFLIALVRFVRDGDSMDWLLAAGFLGMGIFTKTFPVILAPLLAAGARSLNWRTLLLGAAMVAGPFAISLAPMYVLNPSEITAHVLGYRSFGASFGIQGFFTLAGADLATIYLYGKYWSIVFYLGMICLAIFLWRRQRVSENNVILLAALILLFLLTTGSGYGWQYWFWLTPILLVCYREHSGAFRAVVWIWGVAISVTALIEYAVVPSLGQFWHWNHSTPQLDAYSDQWNHSDLPGAKLQLVASLATFAMLFCGISLLRGKSGTLATGGGSGDNIGAERD